MNHQKPLRILHLPVIVLNQGTLYVQALRKLGHKCDYLLYDVSKEDASLHDQCDISLGLTEKGYWERMRTICRFIRESLDDYDIYHFHSGRTFVPLVAFSRWSFMPNSLGRYFQFLDFLDLPYLKWKGKKIVFQFWGCDIRNPDFDLQCPDSACLVCPEEIRKTQCDRKLKEKMNRLTLKYGDARLSSGDLNTCYRDFLWVENAIDTDDWKALPPDEIPERFRRPTGDTLKIYHSFSKSASRNDVKGTEYIVQAVKDLQAEGHKVELMFFSDVPHQEIRYYQMQADIVVDQLKCGHYGNTAVECLSLGKPVVSHLRKEVEALTPQNHPIIKADAGTIKETLRKLIIYKEYRDRMGTRSRAFALRHHSLEAVGRQLEDIYYSLF